MAFEKKIIESLEPQEWLRAAERSRLKKMKNQKKYWGKTNHSRRSESEAAEIVGTRPNMRGYLIFLIFQNQGILNINVGELSMTVIVMKNSTNGDLACDYGWMKLFLHSVI